MNWGFSKGDLFMSDVLYVVCSMCKCDLYDVYVFVYEVFLYTVFCN